jgi:hypothetical protein
MILQPKKFSTIKYLNKEISKIVFNPNCFLGNGFAPKKILDKKILKIFFYPNCFRGNDFATKKNFRQKINSQNVFLSKLFSRK